MTKAQLALNYHRCSLRELRKFAQDRSLPIADSARAKKVTFVKALRNADIHATFRFLDLAPELRNKVYEELLILRNAWKCYPQIPATAKEIDFEASSILYGDNLVQISITGVVTRYPRRRYDSYLRIHDVEEHFLVLHHRLPDCAVPARGYRAWPTFLSKVRFLDLTITMGKDTTREPGQFKPMNHILFTLSCFLASSHALRRLRIRVNCNFSNPLGNEVLSIVYPLARLTSLAICFVNGADNYITLDDLKAIQATNEVGRTDFLQARFLLHAEADAYLDLEKASRGAIMIWLFGSARRRMRSNMVEIEKLLNQDLYMDADRESRLQKGLRKLQDELESLTHSEIARLQPRTGAEGQERHSELLKKFVECRAARQSAALAL